MPTKAFYNLDSNKQTKILKAAKKEFSDNYYEDASINKIIKEINMPRGSFYLYFENKEDLYLYILELYLKDLKKVLFNLLKQNNHEIFKSVICLYDYIIENNTEDQNLIKNIFKNMNSKTLEFAMPELLKKEVDGYIVNFINLDNYNIDIEDMNVVMSIIFPLLFANLGRTLAEPNNKELVRAFYIKQINIIKKGLERK